ncbi:MAG TPA: hypothetical protein VGK76_07690 [Candidatus Eisenbacteria bacterium]
MSHRTFPRLRLLAAPVMAASVALSCAGPNKLAQQSEKAYGQGEVEKAYQKAARALRKDPENRRALTAMSRAAEKIMEERMAEIRGLAALDTVAAAKRSLNLDSFRQELVGYRVILAPDSSFDRDEAAIRHGAAGIEYRRALDGLDGGYPKRAYDELLLVRALEPDYRDVGHRIEQAYEEARPRVALLPFANQTDLATLSKGFADRAYTELMRRTGAPEFRFTDLVPRERVYDAVPVSMLERIDRREAARFGRKLGVDRVIVGRFYGMRSSANSGNYTQTIFRKTVDKDEKGATRERYVEHTIDILTRDREISVGFEYQVLGVDEGALVGAFNGTMKASAHAIFSSSPVAGDCDDYCLVPPDMKRSDPDRAKRIETDWEDRCGGWKLVELLEHARREKGRSGYGSRYEDASTIGADGRAFFPGELPSEGELASLAFGQVWEPLVRTLRDLDRCEPPEIPARP